MSGLTERCRDLAVSFYAPIVHSIAVTSSPREAEMAKLIENTYRQVNIALVNELAVMAKDLGVDIWEALHAAATKPFGYQAFWPGRAWAGTASRSTPPTCRGAPASSSATASASSSTRTRSTTGCPTTWRRGSPRR